MGSKSALSNRSWRICREILKIEKHITQINYGNLAIYYYLFSDNITSITCFSVLGLQ
jgi:hypothetical protein